MHTFEKARISDAITRAEMAKMIVNYMNTPLRKGGAEGRGFEKEETNQQGV